MKEQVEKPTEVKNTVTVVIRNKDGLIPGDKGYKKDKGVEANADKA